MKPELLMFLVFLGLVLLTMVGRVASAIGRGMQRRQVSRPKSTRPTVTRSFAPSVRQAEIAAPQYEVPPVVRATLPMTLLTNALHLFINGETGGGKTVFLHALTQVWVKRGARVLVCDSAARSGYWPGCDVFGVGLWFEDMALAVQEFEDEFKRRNADSLDYDHDEQHWYLVVDEFKHANRATNGRIQEIAERLTEQGRKYNLHMVIATQSDQGGTNDIKNVTAFRKNFSYVVELFPEYRSTVKRGSGAWVGEFTTPLLPDPKKVYHQPGDPRYDRFRRRLAGEAESAAPRSAVVAAPVTKDVVGAVLDLVDEMAAELPHVGELAEGTDPKTLDGARDESIVYLRPELFTNGLESLGLADRKGEIERLLDEAGLLDVDKSMRGLNKYYKQKRLARGIKAAPWYAVRRAISA
jgi:hypothetical protein